MDSDKIKFIPGSFEIGICWPLIRELATTLIFASRVHVFEEKKKEFSDADFSLCVGRTVLLCGTYYDQKSIETVVEKAKKVTVYVFSESELGKYGDKVEYVTDLRTEALTLLYPWLNCLFRRCTKDEQQYDEAFYRGFLLECSTKNLGITEGLRKLIDGKFSLQFTEMVENGVTVKKVHEMDAKNAAKFNGRKIKWGPFGMYDAYLVIAGPNPVMPTVMEAARQPDVHLGISMRYTIDGKTRFTFYSSGKDNINLDCVHEAPYHGGGRPECKGTTVDKHIVYDKDAEHLEDMFKVSDKVFLAKSGAILKALGALNTIHAGGSSGADMISNEYARLVKEHCKDLEFHI